jgi:hypothetical protein
MSVITRLVLTSTGDTGLECFTTLDANDAALDTAVATKADSVHTHGAGGVVYSIVANEAALGTGATDGEVKVCSVTGNKYMWEAGTTKWQPQAGNQYTTAALPTAAVYNILTGTRVYDTTLGRMKYWNATAFIFDDYELRKSFVL